LKERKYKSGFVVEGGKDALLREISTPLVKSPRF
jgi:hypothetical protein